MKKNKQLDKILLEHEKWVNFSERIEHNDDYINKKIEEIEKEIHAIISDVTPAMKVQIIDIAIKKLKSLREGSCCYALGDAISKVLNIGGGFRLRFLLFPHFTIENAFPFRAIKKSPRLGWWKEYDIPNRILFLEWLKTTVEMTEETTNKSE